MDRGQYVKSPGLRWNVTGMLMMERGDGDSLGSLALTREVWSMIVGGMWQGRATPSVFPWTCLTPHPPANPTQSPTLTVFHLQSGWESDICFRSTALGSIDTAYQSICSSFAAPPYPTDKTVYLLCFIIENQPKNYSLIKKKSILVFKSVVRSVSRKTHDQTSLYQGAMKTLQCDILKLEMLLAAPPHIFSISQISN